MNDIKNTIICGENDDVLPTLPSDSVDTIITDPPYGLGFMGKKWDTFKPDNVTKGVLSSSRKKPVDNSEARNKGSQALEAGRYDRSYKANVAFQAWFAMKFIEMLRVLKPGGTMLCFGGSRTYHRVACAAEDAGFILKDCIMWIHGSGFPKATDISKQLNKTENQERSSSAQLWNGWKSHGLKPAYEPIIVAMKANDGTYANNALTHGVAGLNIDAGRIAFQSDADKKSAVFGRGTDIMGGNYVGATHSTGETNIQPDDKGRFPANVIFDEVAAAMLDDQSGDLSSGSRDGEYNTGSFTSNGKVSRQLKGNCGGASRFFYCAKSSKSERNVGCDELEDRVGGSMTVNEGDSMDLGAASLSGEKTQRQQTKNHHPTVKPLKLMEYLCKLTSTPTGGIILDPFAGSGTTLLAAYNTGRDYIGIERDPKYVKIIEARLSNARSRLGLFEN